MTRPRIGITCDTAAPNESDERRGDFRYESPAEYARAVGAAGGAALLLPFELDALPDYLELCDAIVLTGGDDPDTTAFGEPVHPKAKVMHPQRQAFERALLEALDQTAHPVLGICLGMQWMALHAGGALHQHLPDAPKIGDERARFHREGKHAIQLCVSDHPVLSRDGDVHSRHHQAVRDPGNMRTVALSDAASGGVIEAIDRPGGRFYLGVQWHPEHTDDPVLGAGLFEALVRAAGGR